MQLECTLIDMIDEEKANQIIIYFDTEYRLQHMLQSESERDRIAISEMRAIAISVAKYLVIGDYYSHIINSQGGAPLMNGGTWSCGLCFKYYDNVMNSVIHCKQCPVVVLDEGDSYCTGFEPYHKTLIKTREYKDTWQEFRMGNVDNQNLHEAMVEAMDAAYASAFVLYDMACRWLDIDDTKTEEELYGMTIEEMEDNNDPC